MACVPLDEGGQDPGWFSDDAATGQVLQALCLPLREVAVLLVDLDPQAEPLDVELGVELGGVDVLADAEGLHRAGGRRREQHGPVGQPGDGLLVAEEDVEGLRQRLEQRVAAAGVGERDADAADRLAVGAVDEAAAYPAEDADPVAGAEEREVGRHHLLGEAGQLRLDPQLRGGLLLGRVADVERSAPQQDPGPVVEVHRAQRVALEPDPPDVGRGEAADAAHGGELVLRGLVLGAGAEEQERLHACTAAPDSISASTSSTPQAVRASRVWAPGPPGGMATVLGVRLKRGAGAGWVMPSISR